MLYATKRFLRAVQYGTMLQPCSTPYGIKLFGGPFDATFQMTCRGLYGKFIEQQLSAACSDLTFIDIGANVGLYSCLLYKHFHGKVIAFEPNPIVFGYLQKNLLLNGCASAFSHCGAVVDSNIHSLDFHVPHFHSGGGALNDGGNLMPSITSRVTAFGPSLIKAIVETAERFAIKIDVEGAEWGVVNCLRMAGVLQRVDCLIVEFKNSVRTDGSAEKTREMLKGAGLRQVEASGSDVHGDEVFVRI